jgi:acetolactate synthase-1/2/3 large subunit
LLYRLRLRQTFLYGKLLSLDQSESRGKGAPIHSIVVSGLDEVRGVGGVFAVDDDSVCQIDDVPTAGLAFNERTGDWIRAAHPVFSPAVDGTVLSYDPLGDVRLRSLSMARDLHDVQIIKDEILVVASHENAVFRIPRVGAPKSIKQLPGEPDSWHLNCLAGHEGEIFASAFCDGRRHRGWIDCHTGSGIVFSLATGEVVATELDMPHSPLFIDDMLLVCNSGGHKLVAINPCEPGRHIRSISLDGFTRGLAVLGDRIFVGVSVRRKASDRTDPVANVVILDRDSWQIVDRVTVPIPEIYDVRIVPRQAVDTLERGANRVRHLIATAGVGSRGVRPVPGYPTQRCDASGSSAILHARDVCVKIFTKPRRRMSVGELVEVSANLTNLSARTYPVGVGGDHPIHLSYRWMSESGKRIAPDHNPLRTLLPEDFLAGNDMAAVLLVRAPATAGLYRLRITLVQEHVFWFDDVNSATATIGPLVVVMPSLPIGGILKHRVLTIFRREPHGVLSG